MRRRLGDERRLAAVVHTGQRSADTIAERDSDDGADGDRESDGRTNGETDSESGAHSDREPDRRADADADADRNTEADGDAKSDAFADPTSDADAKSDPDRDADGNPEANVHADPDADGIGDRHHYPDVRILMTNSRLLALTAFAGLLGGCSVGQAVTIPPVLSGSSGASSVAMKIVIPAAPSSSSDKRSPQYLTSSVKSMRIVVSQGTTIFSTQDVGLRPGDPGCSTTLPTTCSVTLHVPVGNDTFELTSYDGYTGTAVSGNAVSHALVPKTIVSGSNSLPVVLHGIVNAISVSTGAEGIYEGAKFTLTASIYAQDADNNAIVGPFDSPVTITADGTLIAIAGGSATMNSPSDTFTFTYNIPDPYPASHNGKATFSAGSVFLQNPIIDNALTLEHESTHPGGIAVWYDAADSATFTSVAGKVSSWLDRTPSAHSVSQATAAAQPTLVMGVFTHANKQALQFAAGQYLAGTGFPPGEYTVFVVAMGSANPGNLVAGGGAAGTLAHALSVPAAGQIAETQGGLPGATLSGVDVTSPYYAIAKLAQGTVGTGTATLSYHGSTVPPATSATVTMTPANDPSIVINALNATGSGAAANTIGEVIVLDHAATDAERILYEEYLHRKWDI